MWWKRRFIFRFLCWRVIKITSKHNLFSKPFCKFSRFGVCCVFMVTACGSTVSQNCSYIKNPSYPSAYTATTSCQYTIQKCDSCKLYNNIHFSKLVNRFLLSCLWYKIGFWTVYYKWSIWFGGNWWRKVPRYFDNNYCK